MPYTPEQIAKIRQKDAALPDALKRDPLTSYFEGYFFVTLNTRGEAPILSWVTGRVGAEGVDAPRCEYTELGRGVISSWERMPTVCPAVRIIACEVMPEHFHGLLQLFPGNKRHLGSLISGFMSGCTHAYWDTLGIDWHSNRFDQGAYALKVDRDADHTRSLRGPALFVRGYNDVEPITPEQVQVKIEYIRKQAEKRLIQGDRHECFRINRKAHSQHWNMEAVTRAIAADRYFSHYAEPREEAIGKVLRRINNDDRSQQNNQHGQQYASMGQQGVVPQQPIIPVLDYLGNRALMANPAKLPLVCHRADASRFELQRRAVLDAARQGWVIVSAFISANEREIKQQLMVEQLPFIEIMDNGFSERYKPSGKAFYACGENRLVQITCWQYQYQRESVVSREMCLVMNELARIISGRSDDWWKG